jgi:hypothetical protein
VALGNTEPDVLTSIAARLARLDRELTPAQTTTRSVTASGGHSLKDLAPATRGRAEPRHLASRFQRHRSP